MTQTPPPIDSFRAYAHKGGGSQIHANMPIAGLNASVAITPIPAAKIVANMPIGALNGSAVLSTPLTPIVANMPIGALAASVMISPLPSSQIVANMPIAALVASVAISAAHVYWLSPLVDSTGFTDVSAAVQSFLNSVPDGAVARFQPGGTYEIESMLLLTNRNIIVDTYGATIVQKNPVPFPIADTTIGLASDGVPIPTSSHTPISISVNELANFDTTNGTSTGPSVIAFDTQGVGSKTIAQFDWNGKSAASGPGQLLNCTIRAGSGTLHAGARICESTPITNPAATDNAHRAFFQVTGGNCQIVSSTTPSVFQGSSHQAGTGDDAYIPALEEQHLVLATTVQSLFISNIDGQDIFGDFAYLQWTNNPAAICHHVHITGCNFDRNGRVGISPMGVDALEIDHCTFNNIRRSFYDFEPPSDHCQLTNAHMHDNVYGANRLQFMSGSGGVGYSATVANVLFENESSSSPYDVTFYSPRWNQANGSTYRRGSFTFRNCTSSAQFGSGSPGGGFCFDLHAVDGVDIEGVTQPLQVRSPIQRLVRATNCTNVTVNPGGNPNTISPVSNTQFNNLLLNWEDDFQRANGSPLGINAPFATSAGYTRLTGGVLSIASNQLATDGAGVDTLYRASVVMPSADGVAAVVLGSLTTDAVAADVIAFGAALRLDPIATTGYVAYVFNTGAANVAGNWHAVLFKVVAGVWTQIHAPVAIGAIPVVGDTLSLVLSGTTLTVQYNFVTQFTQTDNTIDGSTVGGTQPGVYMRRKQTTAAVINAAIETFTFHV